MNILSNKYISIQYKVNFIESSDVLKSDNKISKPNLEMGGLMDDWNK